MEPQTLTRSLARSLRAISFSNFKRNTRDLAKAAS